MNTPSINVESMKSKANGLYKELCKIKNIPEKYKKLEPERKEIAKTLGVTLGIFVALGFIFGFKAFLCAAFGYAIKHIVVLLNPAPKPEVKIAFKQVQAPKDSNVHICEIIKLFDEKKFNDIKRDQIMQIIVEKKENYLCPLSAEEDNWTFLKLFANDLALVLPSSKNIVNANLYIYQLIEKGVDPITKAKVNEDDLNSICEFYDISDKSKLVKIINSNKTTNEKVTDFEMLSNKNIERFEEHHTISTIYYTLGGIATVLLGGVGSVLAFGLGIALSKEEITYKDLQILVGTKKPPIIFKPEQLNDDCPISFNCISELDPVNVITVHGTRYDIRAYTNALLGQKKKWFCPITKTILSNEQIKQIHNRFGLTKIEFEEIYVLATTKVSDFELAIDGTGKKFHKRCDWRRSYLLKKIGEKNPELKKELIKLDWVQLNEYTFPGSQYFTNAYSYLFSN